MSTATAPPRSHSAEAPLRQRRTVRRPALMGLALLVVVAVALAAACAGDEAQTVDRSVETAAVTVTGDVLPDFAEGSDPAIGLRAPALEGVDFEGDAVSFTPGEQPTILLFTTHWCPYCEEEMAELAPWLAEGGAETVNLLIVSTRVDATRDNYPPSQWLAEHGWTGPVLVDSAADEAYRAFGGPVVPFFVFVDGEGRVAGRLPGTLAPEALEDAFAALSG